MLTSANAWILVADATHARLYETRAGGAITLVRAFHHPENQRRDVDPTRVADEFARMLSGVLAQGNLWRRFRYLVVVASPSFAAALRARMTEPVLDRVIASVETDIASVDENTIAELPEVTSLRPWFERPTSVRATARISRELVH